MASTNVSSNTKSCELRTGNYSQCFDWAFSLPREQHEHILITAAVIAVVYCFFGKRRSFFPNVLDGRPGLPIPIDSLGSPKQRKALLLVILSMTASCVGLLGGGMIRYSSLFEVNNRYVTTLCRPFVLAFYVGLYYYPIFAGVHYSYGAPGCLLGGGYTLSVLVVRIVYIKKCIDRVLPQSCDWLIPVGSLAVVPEFFGLSALVLFFCVRLFRLALSLKNRRSTGAPSTGKQESLEKEVICEPGWEYRYVRKLFMKPNYPSTADFNTQSRCHSIAIYLQKLWKNIYDKEDPFHYSARILIPGTVSMVALCIISIVFTADSYKYYEQHFNSFLTWLNNNESQKGYYFFGDLQDATEINIILSCVIAFLLGIWQNISVLQSYKRHLKQLFCGQHPILSGVHARQHRHDVSRLNRYSKFVGYQTAYLLISFFLTASMVLAFTSLIALITLIGKHYGWNFVWSMVVGPVLAFSLFAFVYLLTFVLMFFVFTDRTEQGIVFTNVRALHNFNYFMIFYRLILGFFSALQRVIISAALGLAHLPRLDRSLMMEGFTGLDRGYQTFLGFISVESELTNPTKIVFSKLLIQSRPRTVGQRGVSTRRDTVLPTSVKKNVSAVSMRARNRWHVYYTLLKNPSLVQDRRN